MMRNSPILVICRLTCCCCGAELVAVTVVVVVVMVMEPKPMSGPFIVRSGCCCCCCCCTGFCVCGAFCFKPGAECDGGFVMILPTSWSSVLIPDWTKDGGDDFGSGGDSRLFAMTTAGGCSGDKVVCGGTGGTCGGYFKSTFWSVFCFVFRYFKYLLETFMYSDLESSQELLLPLLLPLLALVPRLLVGVEGVLEELESLRRMNLDLLLDLSSLMGDRALLASKMLFIWFTNPPVFSLPGLLLLGDDVDWLLFADL